MLVSKPAMVVTALQHRSFYILSKLSLALLPVHLLQLESSMPSTFLDTVNTKQTFIWSIITI